MKKILLIFLLIVPLSCFACEQDAECGSSSVCLKTTGNMYGTCVEVNLGNLGNRNSTVSQPIYKNSIIGNACSSNTECEPGSYCVKDGSPYGACAKKSP